MHLRKLKTQDAQFMLEWMHDDSVIHYMRANFAAMQIDDCMNFIEESMYEKQNVNLAITDDNDEYMGTVSLKNILKEKNAEFAITIRKKAMGKGFSAFAMKQIADYARDELYLKYMYWFVSMENERAIRFYDKNQYQRISYENLSKLSKIPVANAKNYIWYIKNFY